MEKEMKTEDVSKIYNGLPNTELKSLLSASMLNQMGWYIQYVQQTLAANAPKDLEEVTEFEKEILDEGENG